MNNDVVFERLYDGTIKTEIMKNVIDLCKDLEGIDLQYYSSLKEY